MRAHSFFISLLLFILVCSSATLKSGLQFKVEDVSLERIGQDSLMVSMTVEITDDAVASRCAVVLSPYVLQNDACIELDPITVYRLDSRGNRYNVRSDSEYASGVAAEMALVCGTAQGMHRYGCTIGGVSADGDVDVYMQVMECRSGDVVVMGDLRLLASFAPLERPVFSPDYFFRSVAEGEYSLMRSVSIPVDVLYESSKPSVFDAVFADNGRMLRSLGEEIRRYVGSPYTKVSSITMKCYTSIEGSEASNRRMASSRLNGVYNYLQSLGSFGRKSVRLLAVGEDWDGVRDWVSDTYWNNVMEVRNIVRNNDITADGKETLLRDMSLVWENMSERLFPSLNRIECVIDYELTPLPDDAVRREAYEGDTFLLSQRDYSLIIQSLNVWSVAWYDAVADFESQYPLCRQAAVNAFAALLSKGDLNGASRFLRYGDSDSDMLYYRMLWMMFSGDVDGAYDAAVQLQGKDAVYDTAIVQIMDIHEWKYSSHPWSRKP